MNHIWTRSAKLNLLQVVKRICKNWMDVFVKEEKNVWNSQKVKEIPETACWEPPWNWKATYSEHFDAVELKWASL